MVAEGRKMNTGFGRRIIPSDSTELVLVPDTPVEVHPGISFGRDDVKERVRSALMTRIDPVAAARIPRRILQVKWRNWSAL
jgi:hypothetical protein